MLAGIIIGMVMQMLTLGIGGAMSADDIRLIDMTPPGLGFTNFIFRGPYAAGEQPHEWNQTALTVNLLKAASASNISLPVPFFTVDVSLLTVEWQSLVAESNFFAANPHVGRFSHWPMFGTNLNASTFDPSTRAFIAQQAPQPFGDYLPQLTDLLRAGLFAPNLHNRSVPLVFYIHCSEGKDRTGQVSAAYYLKWLRMSWNDALYYDQMCVGAPRALKPQLTWGAQWYCLELEQASTGDCLIETPTAPSPPCLLPSSSTLGLLARPPLSTPLRSDLAMLWQ
jgi:hypothetical protein